MVVVTHIDNHHKRSNYLKSIRIIRMKLRVSTISKASDMANFKRFIEFVHLTPLRRPRSNIYLNFTSIITIIM